MIQRAPLVVGLALLCAVAGCQVVDQRSFGGAPRPPAPDQLAQALASHGATPLIVIAQADADPYDESLRTAVQAAEARDPNVHFRIESVAPATGSLDAQQAALAATSLGAQQMADRMGDLGIAPDRISLAARTDPAASERELRLFAQ